MKKTGTGKLRHKKIVEEQPAANPALDNWMWILRARAAARQALDESSSPPVPLPEAEAERQSAPPE